MGVFDHKQTTACGTWCAKTGQSCAAHSECIWCYERWPCETAMIREDIAKELLRQPVLADHFKSARLIAPWLPDFQDLNSCPYTTFSHTRHWCGYDQCRES